MKKISFPTDVKEPTRTGSYREPKKSLKVRTPEQMADRTRAHADKEKAMRALDSVSLFQFGPIMEDGMHYPLEIELQRAAMPPSLRVVKDDHGYEVLEETTEGGNVVRYRIYTRKTSVNPTSSALSGLSRLLSFYRVGKDTLHINTQHPALDAYFSRWRKYLWDDKYDVLYRIEDGKPRPTNKSAIPFGGMRSLWSIRDYLMRRYGLSYEDADRLAREIKSLK